MATGLSKSRFVKGWQCHNMLWWTVHEPDAPELITGKALQDLFDQGAAVGERAREEFHGGVLIDLPYYAYREKVQATKEALDDGARTIFEASFLEDGVFVCVDVLEQTSDGFTLIEVKSSTKVKKEYLPDAAVQMHVVGAAGLPVTRVELMHLNRDHRHPDTEPLLVREDITDKVLEIMGGIPDEIAAQKEMLSGDFPDLPLGVQCVDVRDCPFQDRCWPMERDSVRTLYYVSKRTKLALLESGVETVADVPDDMKLRPVAVRQVQAARTGELITEPGLDEALALLVPPIGFLDFETVSRALPVWDGFAPWGAVPAQFSYHELQADGTCTHAEWLAEGPADPSRAIAEALIDACAKATRIVVYTPFEHRQIETLKARVPSRTAELESIQDRLFDLYKVIEQYVYHPDFQGTLGLKAVLPALVPDLGYDDLEIQDGMDASVDIARLMLRPEEFTEEEGATLRRDLLAYCERDTWAMVRLLEQLRELAD